MNRKPSSTSPSSKRTAGPRRRRPLADITSTSLNRISTNSVTDRQPITTACEPKNARNQLTNLFMNASAPIVIPNVGCVPTETAEPVLRLCASNASLLNPMPIWDVRCSALWCMDLSSFNIFTESAEVLPPNTCYQNVVHPCLSNNLAWLTSQNEKLYEHFSSLEQESRYQWDLSYVARLKKIAKADRAGLVDTMVYFGMRVRLHHPTVHLAVSILDRYLSALLCPPSGAGSSDREEERTEAAEVEKVKESEQVKQLLSLPCAMKALACACVWLAVTMEEKQKQFNPEWFHDVLFLHTPHPPTVRQLAQLMNSISMTLDFDLLAPTVHTFLVRLVPLAKFTGEEVQVARCLSERALLEPLCCTKHQNPRKHLNYHTKNTDNTNNTNNTNNTQPYVSTILGMYLPSCIAASCVFLTRAHMLALQHQLPLLHYLKENHITSSSSSTVNVIREKECINVVTTEENTMNSEEEEVWTANLAHFSGYSASQLLPCVQCLHSMLQLETYHRARLYAHTLCPSGSYSDLQDTVQAMTSMDTTTGDVYGSRGGSSGVGKDSEEVKKDPLKEYLKLLPHILLHMQGTISSSVSGVSTTNSDSTQSAITVTVTPTTTVAITNLSTTSDCSVNSVASSATTVNTTTQYVPLFRTFSRNLSTESTTNTTITNNITNNSSNNNTTSSFYYNENHSQQYSQLSQLTDVEASQATVLTQLPGYTNDSASSKALSRQVSNRSVDTVSSTCTTETSILRSSKRLRTSNTAYLPIASATTATTATTATCTSHTINNNDSITTSTLYANPNPTNPQSNHKDVFFDPARLMYSQDGYSNPFPQYVHNNTNPGNLTTTRSSTSTTGMHSKGIASFGSVLGKRTSRDMGPSVLVGGISISTSNTTQVSAPCDSIPVPELPRVLTLNAVMQDKYRLYPVPYLTNHTNTTTTTTTTTNATTTTTTTTTTTNATTATDTPTTNKKNVTVPSLLDYGIIHTEDLPAIRESVRLKYYSVYGRLVTCPPI